MLHLVWVRGRGRVGVGVRVRVRVRVGVMVRVRVRVRQSLCSTAIRPGQPLTQSLLAQKEAVSDSGPPDSHSAGHVQSET